MKTVSVNTGSPYRVIIQNDSLSLCGARIRSVFPDCSRAAVITDDTVASLYLPCVVPSLEQQGFSVCVFTFPHGEDSKSAAVLMEIYRFLAEHNITRGDFLVALGGGVVGDLAGFAAATYLRGIPFVQIPTTFLAAIDSSVGGKTAINIEAGKNLVGAFHQPALVLCDPQVFKTLSPEIFADGCAEMIKYAMIWSEDFFRFLEQGSIREHMEEIVAYCVDIKRQVVEQDEHDCGIRMILNYGHTLGHAIEKVTNHTVTHGQGVAMGMMLITRLAAGLDRCSPELLPRLSAVLKKYRLPDRYCGSLCKLAESCLVDKKRTGSKIRLILVPEIGKAEIVPVDVDRFTALLQEESSC